MAQRTHTAAAAPATGLDRDASATLAEQLAALYAQRIAQRRLAPGARLPSVRGCASEHGVSPSTVVAAYDMLQAQGLAEARQQRGYFVRERAAALPTRVGAAPRGRLASPPVDATALIRGMFEHQRSSHSPGMGTLPADWLDLPLLHAALRRAMAEEVRDEQISLRYGSPAGDARLRDALGGRLADLGIAADAQQIVTTAGATQALDLVSRLLLAPGDSVLVDEPGWAVEYARLTRMGVKLLPVPRGAAGPDVAAMRRLLEAPAGAAKPRLYITVSVLHNPTGAMLSLAVAHQLLKLAEAHDLTIVEDDTYAWLAPAQAPRLAALDQLQRTVYVSGFSKIVTPNWRVGFLAASPALVERCIDQKLLTGLTTPTLPERALAIMLEQGTLRRHAERVTQRLASARQRVQRLAQEAGCRFAAPPQGLFGWVDAGIDTEHLAAALHAEGWLLAPGTLFHATPRASTLMRINFATAQDARFWRALAAARQTLQHGVTISRQASYHTARKTAAMPAAVGGPELTV